MRETTMAKAAGTQMLAGVPLFAGLSTRHLKRIRDLAEPADYMAGASLVKEGTEGDAFYVIIEGLAKVVAGKRTIHRLMPGDYFGEISLLDGKPRSATIRADDEVTTLSLTAWQFEPMLTDHPKLAHKLLLGLCAHVRAAEASSIAD
jgi:CRP/FNR family cyclic AMP-dependent transcriptional regulator